VTASQKPKVLPGPRTKKIKLETASQTLMMPMPAIPAMSESMLADMATKPKTGSQWHNTDLLPIMLENGAWRRQFIPTVLLWAGSQPNFWTIEAPNLLCALQTIFATIYPGVEHKVQLKGPIMGVVSAVLIYFYICHLDRNLNFNRPPSAYVCGRTTLVPPRSHSFLIICHP